MKIQKLGKIIMGIGIFLFIFPFLSDSLGIGKKGIQAAQLLIIQAGVIFIFIGIGIFNQSRQNDTIPLKALIKNIFHKILDLPTFTWVILGFFITYVLLFIPYVFLNSEHVVHYFNRYLPEINPIGRDLTFNTSSIKNWLSGKGLYDSGDHYYPPLYAVVFSPFLLLSYPSNYYVMTAITIGAIIICTLVIPQLVQRNDPVLMIFFFITVIFSYGMQFELERGQFNILALALSLTAIYLFHYQNSFRHLAYLLFSIAVQIKLYPVIFILMFVRDWHDWKNNLLRLAGLGLTNIALLFVLGYDVFRDFTKALPTLLDAVWIRPYNHSLQSFVDTLTSTGLGVFSSATTSWFAENSNQIKIILVSFYFICLMAILAQTYKNNKKEINFDLLLACTIGAMILPSVSIDYKLPLLSPTIAMALSHRPTPSSIFKKSLSIILIASISLAYSVTLFSFVYRPTYLENCYLLFMIILTAITILNLLENGNILKDTEDLTEQD